METERPSNPRHPPAAQLAPSAALRRRLSPARSNHPKEMHLTRLSCRRLLGPAAPWPPAHLIASTGRPPSISRRPSVASLRILRVGTRLVIQTPTCLLLAWTLREEFLVLRRSPKRLRVWKRRHPPTHRLPAVPALLPAQSRPPVPQHPAQQRSGRSPSLPSQGSTCRTLLSRT